MNKSGANTDSEEKELNTDKMSEMVDKTDKASEESAKNAEQEQQPSEPAAEAADEAADEAGATEADKALAELQASYDELKDKYLRQTAEYDNYRKRTMREKMELTKNAGQDLLVALLPVIDDFERALSHMNEASDVAALREGVELIYSKFGSYLQKNGVTPIDAVNKEFDTDLHEAVTKIPAPTPDMKGKVLDCIEKGYMLNDKVIRFSKVVVCE